MNHLKDEFQSCFFSFEEKHETYTVGHCNTLSEFILLSSKIIQYYLPVLSESRICPERRADNDYGLLFSDVIIQCVETHLQACSAS